MNKGIFLGLGAYLIWGFLPVYLKQVQSVPAPQILGHRIVWSLVLLAIITVLRKEGKQLIQVSAHRSTMLLYAASSLLLGLNWLLYIWAVNTGNIVESSLGYFINPLVSVLFGVTFLKERLRIWQWLPVSIATCGVIYLAVDFGRLPWIALGLAATFGFYGLMKKISPLGSLFGLTLETAILFIPAVIYLLIADFNGNGSFAHQNILTDLLLIAAGVITAVPLLLFGSAARLIPLSLLGLLQYVAPTCQFLLGVLIYREPFSTTRLIGFAIIWFALVLFWLEGFLNSRKISGFSKHRA